MTRTVVISGLVLTGTLGLPMTALADTYITTPPKCSVTPGTVASGKPVTLDIIGGKPGATITVNGSGPVSVTTSSGQASSGGTVSLAEQAGPSAGTGTFTVTGPTITGPKSSQCSVKVQPVELQPTKVARVPVLPFTGASDITPAVLGALALVGVGGGLVAAGRRRRSTT
jgi:hypothetical protein